MLSTTVEPAIDKTSVFATTPVPVTKSSTLTVPDILLKFIVAVPTPAPVAVAVLPTVIVVLAKLNLVLISDPPLFNTLKLLIVYASI